MDLFFVSPLAKDTTTVAWVELNTTQGNFVVQEGHAPMIVLLAPNSHVNYSLVDGTEHTRLITHGIAEITRNTVTIIIG